MVTNNATVASQLATCWLKFERKYRAITLFFHI